MSTGFNTQVGNGEYRLQFETDNKEHYLLMQETARRCVDGKPKTNADRIRAMSDEELAASHLIIPCFYDDDGYGECKYGWHDRKQTCEECKLEWLKQPAEAE